MTLKTLDVEPIDLGRMHGYVADELWRVFRKGVPAPWLDEIRAARCEGDDLEATLDNWSTSLVACLENPARAANARRVLHRLSRHADHMARNRRVYSWTTPEEIRHRYWPTGLREHIERDNLYSIGFCPKPQRFITPQTRIASAGSCFAIEIGRALRTLGYNYFITEPAPPHLHEEQAEGKMYGQFNARYGAIFNAPALRQLVERGLGLIDMKPYVYEQDGVWHDPYRDGLIFESPDEFAASLPVFEVALKRVLLEAEVFVCTLGVNEVWHFVNDHTYLSRVPWKLSPALLGRKVLTVDDNIRELQRLVDAWRPFNPDVRIIVTVSPVPLLATFRSDECNVVVANCHSKSVLRVAAEEFAAHNDGVTYFPAYEAVLYGTRQPFREDGRHVSRQALDRVMTMFRETFCADHGS